MDKKNAERKINVKVVNTKSGVWFHLVEASSFEKALMACFGLGGLERVNARPVTTDHYKTTVCDLEDGSTSTIKCFNV